MISFQKIKVRNLYIDTVKINLNSPKIKIKPALPEKFSDKNKTYSLEQFSSFMGKYKPTAAINGTFFDTITSKPVGNIVIEGKLVNNGCIGVAVCVDKCNQVTFHNINGKLGSKVDWSPFQGAICAGPNLITEGEIDLNPWEEGYRDPSVYTPNRRSAIGLTEYNKLLLVTIKYKITLRTLANIMKDMGCLYAINLDGGSSSALYYRGEYITYTSRPISNVLLIYEEE